MSPSRKILLLTALAGAAVLLTSCSSAGAVRVKPWERGVLADEAMNPARDPLATEMMEHVYFSREAASGGPGIGGAGCGCN